MKLGKIKLLIFLIISLFLNLKVIAENKIITAPLINLDELKPSFEEVDKEEQSIPSEIKLKEKKSISNSKGSTVVKIMGLDKITAKTSEIKIKLGEVKKFGLLEIKALRCGRTEELNSKNDVAYIQIKDLSKSANEKVFIFNGWTFSSEPSLKPIDHAIYDLWLVGCENV